MPRILGICFLAFTVFALSSCEKDPIDTQDEPEEEVIDDTDAEIKFHNGASVTIAALEGSVGEFIFQSTYKWTLEIPEDATWLSADVTSGTKKISNKIKFTAQANEKPVSRSAECIIKSGKNQKVITVTQSSCPLVLTASEVPDYEKIYIPNIDFTGDPLRSDSPWSFCRSKQSEHFIIFWDKKYGEYGLYGEKVGVDNTSPATLASSNRMYVDIDDMLAKAEKFFDLNINILKFADMSGGKSTLDNYKMGICIHYTTEWMAYGSGYDNVVGWLWINPDTCKPIGSTIAHEIGHSFQYQTYCDQIHCNGKADNQLTGWRYGFGGNGGNAYWEQTAQWQSYQSYTNEAFETVNFTEFVNNCHRHFHHEHQRYASYFLHWYMAEKRGLPVIGELWRESYSPYDAIETYQQKYDLSMDELNKELYMYAAKCATWDFNVDGENMHTGQKGTVRDFGKNYIGKIGWSSTKGTGDHEGWYLVDDNRAPEATGFNHIRLNVPEAGTEVKVTLEGMPKAQASIAGWNMGFVALLADGTRVYTDDVRVTATGEATYTVPENCQDLWLVVAATPQEYMRHAWDEDTTNDVVWHYGIKIEGTDLYGTVTFDGTESPASTTIVKDVEVSCAAGYAGPSVALSGAELIQIAKAFVLQPSEIISKLSSGAVKFGTTDLTGSVTTGGYTANGYGYWYGMDGSVQAWSSAYVYAEYAQDTWTFKLGCHPDKVSAGTLKKGDKITIKPTLVYGNYTATIQFNITMVD